MATGKRKRKVLNLSKKLFSAELDKVVYWMEYQ